MKPAVAVVSLVLVVAACNGASSPQTGNGAAPVPSSTSSASSTANVAAPIPAESGGGPAPIASTDRMAPPAGTASSPAETQSTTVRVEVANIGLHIGGGPNDEITKAPIVKSIEPHFPAFMTCFAMADDTKKKGDFGIDLAIGREGGVAVVSKPRTAIGGEGFRKCVVGVFEHIDFMKPRGGKTIASYSLRFTPG